MPDIVLATFNARYEHCSSGLRCLMANLGDLAPRASLLELNTGIRTAEAAEAILKLAPRVLGLGVYVWNARESAMLVAELKGLRPELIIVLGGPEVSHETARQQICHDADFVIKGEGEIAFAGLCRSLLSAEAPAGKFITAEAPDPSLLELPYGLYTAEDIANRVIYAEASRGCPFACEFCLSSLDKTVRNFPLPGLFAAWEGLLARGALKFKFVDRTFNLDMARAAAVLNFFLERLRPGLFLHFEMVPDRFPEELYLLVKKFPAGSLQLEVGVQTFNAAVAARIGRRQDNAAVEKNMLRLKLGTSAHLHADLIAGLPGEDLASFAAGFDRLAALGPQEIQVGILKRLRGAPIARHDEEWQMVYSPYPPYELRSNAQLDFFTMQRLRRFARYWDLVANSGVFAETAALICAGPSPFHNFLAFSDWLYARTGQTHAISRARLADLLKTYVTDALKRPADMAASLAVRDALNARRGSGHAPRRQGRRPG
ncbi:MAG TPA: B12-binding domain-containing radical SAM protein [Elusimicrobia bacterium]|nr:B12-binding domain-containing radical SAM protein [Elusimicrobiota bacterium]